MAITFNFNKMAISPLKRSVSSLMLGKCLPSLKYNASKFSVPYLYFDNYLLAYFPKWFEIYAYDPQKICKTGDLVLIKELSKPMSPVITHEVLEIIYPLGDITDPISGKKVAKGEFRDWMELRNSYFGETENRFNYKKAPRRGWQEDRKDFSHRISYMKYHEFDKGDENESQPCAKGGP